MTSYSSLLKDGLCRYRDAEMSTAFRCLLEEIFSSSLTLGFLVYTEIHKLYIIKLMSLIYMANKILSSLAWISPRKRPTIGHVTGTVWNRWFQLQWSSKCCLIKFDSWHKGHVKVGCLEDLVLSWWVSVWSGVSVSFHCSLWNLERAEMVEDTLYSSWYSLHDL